MPMAAPDPVALLGGPDARTAQPTDPVSGEPVDVARASTSFLAGRVYYFESPQTRQRFEAAENRACRRNAARVSVAARVNVFTPIFMPTGVEPKEI